MEYRFLLHRKFRSHGGYGCIPGSFVAAGQYRRRLLDDDSADSPDRARLIVGVDDGRPDVEFDLSGITWSPGQRINYSLSVSPDAIIMLTPEKIVLPPMGGFSQFNVIVQNESPKAWTIAGTNFYICDNLADLQGWAAGTLTARPM